VAIPAYQNYVAKSKFAAALSEVAAGKTGYDVKMNEGATPTVADSGLQSTTKNCTMDVLPNGGGLKCTIVGGPTSVSGHIINITRDGSGVWACNHDITTDADKIVGTACNAASGS
jgi:type IV pilus assembly protein PilA